MTAWLWLVDAALGVALIGVAARALAAQPLFESVALFVVFGILMTLAWVRLGAPDVALAEAGIGTGFTGALCVAALVRLRRAADERQGDTGDDTADERHRNTGDDTADERHRNTGAADERRRSTGDAGDD